MKKLCGIRPTGKLHLGHYFSVIKPALEGCDVLIAEYHAPESDKFITQVLAGELAMFGVKFEQIRYQSNFFNPDLYFKLLKIAPIGDLLRMKQYMSKEKDPHLLVYPVLMTCDLIGYDEIYVGEDQLQHLEFAREIIKRYNRIYKKKLKIPKAKVVGGRIMDLQDPTKKMSKSNPKGCLFLFDSPKEIEEKIMKATTTPEGEKNLQFIYNEFVGGKYPKGNNKKAKEEIINSLSKKLK